MFCSRINAILLAGLLIVSLIFSFTGCTNDANDNLNTNKDENIELVPVQVDSSSEPILTIKPDSVTKPGKGNKRLKPDVSSVELSPASKSEMYSNTVEECIERLRVYSNPNGNEYDALSLLGRFKYAAKSEDAMMKQLKTASKTWHETVETMVGEKCMVKFDVIKKTAVDLDDPKVSDWISAVGITPENYASVKCAVSTNYSTETVNMLIELVKVDGKWYLAKTDTLSTVKDIITTTIFN